MSACIRLGDESAGHCFPPYPIISASENVFYNGIGAARVGDPYPVHACGNSSHGGAQAEGSPNVFVNGIAQARVGDSVSCGDAAANGSPNVFAN